MEDGAGKRMNFEQSTKVNLHNSWECREMPISQKSLKLNKMGAKEMAQQVKVPTTKSNSLGSVSIPKNHKVERENQSC